MLNLNKTIAGLAILGSLISSVNAEIKIISETDKNGWLEHDQILQIELSGNAKKVINPVFFLGKTDVTSLFTQTEAGVFTYDNLTKALPSGNLDLKIYDGSDWSEIDSIALNVLTPSGFNVSKVTPTVDVNINSKLSDNRTEDAGQPNRKTFNDFDSSISINSEHIKKDLNITASANIVSSSNQEAALRFGERQNEASKVDLSQYIVSATKGKTSASLGHISQGKHPLLVDNLSNRGLMIDRKINQRLNVGVALQSGRQITGYNDILGFTTSKSKIATFSVGLDLLKRTDAAKLELSYLNGTTVAENNFDEGQVPTAEDNSGFGLRLTTNSKSGKLTTDTSFARSRYTNPTQDTLEFNGEALVDVKPTTNNAYSTNINYQLLSNHKLSKKMTTDMSLNLVYSKIEAEYKSLAAFPNPDQELKEIGITGQIGHVAYQARYSRSRDNLEDIETILTTQTSSANLSLNTSLKDFFSDKNPKSLKYKLLPSISLSAQRVHQYALNSPATENSGFNNTNHLPDQLNLTFSNDLSWNFDKWDVGYQTQWSKQDNKQEGRDQADFQTLGHTINLTYRPKDTITVGLSAGRIRNTDVEQNTKRYDKSYGLNLDWAINDKFSLSLSHNKNKSDDNQDISRSLSTTNEAKISYTFNLPTPEGKKLPGQAFIRYAKQKNNNKDRQQDFETNANDSAVFAGINFSF